MVSANDGKPTACNAISCDWLLSSTGTEEVASFTPSFDSGSSFMWRKCRQAIHHPIGEFNTEISDVSSTGRKKALLLNNIPLYQTHTRGKIVWLDILSWA